MINSKRKGNAMERRRNEGGRFSAKNHTDWYKSIEEDTIRRIEEEWQLKQAIEEYYEATGGDQVVYEQAA